ncbi:OsmC family protein [Neptunicella sp. SCSIO 80796]|uniref:OsmC family protein n=1 Tax=Neptunicella plasticusilytica TaxID=3117012 RepID=UPI003A4E3726
MQALPHHYRVNAYGEFDTNLKVQAEGLPAIEVAGPVEFDGPGDKWSPEALLMAAVANCFILSFRAVAKASEFKWLSIECESQGKLDKVERQIQFTHINTHAKLTIARGADSDKAEALLNKAERVCLISNSLLAEKHLQLSILFSD